MEVIFLLSPLIDASTYGAVNSEFKSALTKNNSVYRLQNENQSYRFWIMTIPSSFFFFVGGGGGGGGGTSTFTTHKNEDQTNSTRIC